MGAIPTSPTALLGAAAAGALLIVGAAAAPAARAAEAAPITSFGFAITPSTVAPGGQVVLSVTGCNAAFATVSSGVFDTVSIDRGKTARVTVDRDARRGAQYSVSFTCAGETGSADLTIAGGTGKPTTSSTVGARRSASAVAGTSTGTSAGTGTGASRRATLGVRGGLGGSVAGLDPLELGAGAGLVLGGLVGLGYALRRRDIRRIH
ncbi:hypothetical protein ABT024_39375 [Streptomyces sp. NPDC002812]|uniref:hypothetical protein n=1 Tax=unclassified Streptomyces TaxID=2593676 RepID=UPI00202EA7D0|nr:MULTISPECIES: hypothetical protein [unclassified Streptomyces]MCM1968163.1 hypothetical protein [Streptomyces sp. G1]MCX5130166.1 hypothetical protein [Streptomyces sp. NBC_00347]MCX5301204.1 hypothetical protein [Streptomyces sp. NBC_00193]